MCLGLIGGGELEMCNVQWSNTMGLIGGGELEILCLIGWWRTGDA